MGSALVVVFNEWLSILIITGLFTPTAILGGRKRGCNLPQSLYLGTTCTPPISHYLPCVVSHLANDRVLQQGKWNFTV